MEMGVGQTCVGAEESLTYRNIVAGVAVWNSAGLLLPANKIARLPSELRWLLQFGIAILIEGETGQRNKEEGSPLPSKCGGSALKLPGEL